MSYSPMCVSPSSPTRPARSIANTTGSDWMRAVVDDVVVRALQERRVDRAHRTQAARRHARRERDRVSLGDADVEEALRDAPSANAPVPVPLGIAAVIVTSLSFSAPSSASPLPNTAVYAGLRRRRLAAACRWPGRGPAAARATSRPVLAGGKSLALLRDDVHEARALELAHRRERVDERVEVVSVDRAEVAEAQLLEQHARREERLHALLPLPHERADADPARCPRARRSWCARGCRAGCAGST